MFDISIVIVSWNARQYLADCLKSIQADSEGLSLQVIVVDNDSSDGSPEMVARDFPDVELIQSGGNLGFARGNNLGLEQCKGRYVCLINSDVILLEGCFRKIVEGMDANPRIGMSAPRILNADRTLQRSIRRLPSLAATFGDALFLHRAPILKKLFPPIDMTAEEHEGPRKAPVLSGCFWTVRGEALAEVGGLDERFFMYGEDNDWCKRFREAGWDVVYDPRAEAIHFGGASSANAPVRFFVELRRARLLYFQKHYGCGARILGAWLLFLHSLVRLGGWSLVYCLCPGRRERSRPMIRSYLACLKWLLPPTGMDADNSRESARENE